MEKNSFEGKLPPQVIELEEAVLGAIMLEKDCFLTVNEILTSESFYKDNHSKIFKACERLFSRSEPIDIMTVTQELKKSGELDSVGGAYYITQLTNRVASSANSEFHSRIIQQKFIQRELIRVSIKTMSDAYNDSNDIFDLIDFSEQSLTKLTAKVNTTKIDSIVKLYNDFEIRNIEILKSKNGISGVASGFKKVDDITGGWQKSDLVIIAARPAMGKTSFMLQLARNSAVKFKKKVAIFSIEMSKSQIVTRLMSQETGFNSHKYTRYGLDEGEMVYNAQKCSELISSGIFIDDTPALKISELKSKSRKLKREQNIDMIVIDYLQIMSTGEKSRGKTEDVGLISNSLKALAKELDIPVVALSQMSRDVEKRGGNRHPELSDLRNSGEIEQDADVVIFIHRDEYYGILEDGLGNSTVGKAAIIIAKNRSGAVDTIVLNWESKSTSFSEDSFEDQFKMPENTEFLNQKISDYNKPNAF